MYGVLFFYQFVYSLIFRLPKRIYLMHHLQNWILLNKLYGKILAFEETERLRVEDTVFFIGKNYAIPIRFEFLSCWSFRSKVYGCESRF